MEPTKWYGCVFIIGEGCNLIEETITEIVNFIKQFGTIKEEERIGLKRLAYKIKDEERGYYCRIYFKVPASYVSIIESQLRENPYILKYMIVRDDERWC